MHPRAIVLGVLLLLLPARADLAAAEPRPNFVVILCDDLGYGDLGCFGHPHIKTPNLDALAKAGILFTECYSAAPVCSPSRAGLMTGRSPTRIGIYDWINPGNVVHLRKGEMTIASRLREAGYATCQVGKWHLNGKFNSPEQPQPSDHGFDYWFATQNNAVPSHENPRNFVRNGKRVGELKGFSCQIVVDEAIGWLKKQHAGAKPFFLYACFHETHEKVASPPDLVAQYNTGNLDQAHYFANVANVDNAVGRLLRTLDEMKVGENTVVIFTSDNGPETLHRYPNATRSYGSAGPFRGMKLHLYEGGIRVPGILRWQGKVKGGQTVATPISSVDFLPTFCELAGAEIPKDRKLDGTSLAGLLQGKGLERKTPLYWHYYRSIGPPKAALRQGDWMVLGHWDGPQLDPGIGIKPGDSELIKKAKLTTFELYNLRDDPSQKLDLAASQPERLRELSQLLRARYAQVQADAPIWDMKAEKKE